MIALTTLVLAAALDDVSVVARMGDGVIEAGAAHSFTVELVVPDGISTANSGLPSPFLQLDVPDGITLTDKPSNMDTRQYIGVPYERLMEGTSVEIPFEVDDVLADGATLGIIVTAYLSDADTSRFLRQRLELPIKGGARALPGDATNSHWGIDDTLLKIGDKVEGFAVPLAEGIDPFDLGTVLGERPIFLTTYRAHW